MVDLNNVKESDIWYIVGYITADGCLSSDRRHIDITSKDKDQIILIRNALFLKNKIGIKHRSNEKVKPYYRLQIGDVRFYKYLLNLGLKSKKSLSLGPIRIAENYFIDFLRGIIDGDGNISTWTHRSNHSSQMCLRIYSGSTSFIKWLRYKIQDHFGTKGRIYKTRSKKGGNIIYRIKYGKKEAKVILNQIYYPECLSLERKLAQAKTCLQNP